MLRRELKQFACIQSQCHRKLGEQQLNSVCRPILIHIAGIVRRFIHFLCSTRRSIDTDLMLTQHLRRWFKLRLCLLRVSSLSDVCYIYNCRPIWGPVALLLVGVYFLPRCEKPILSVCILIKNKKNLDIQRMSHWRDLLF